MPLRALSSLLLVSFSRMPVGCPSHLRTPRDSAHQPARCASLTTSPGRIFYPERGECASGFRCPQTVAMRDAFGGILAANAQIHSFEIVKMGV